MIYGFDHFVWPASTQQTHFVDPLIRRHRHPVAFLFGETPLYRIVRAILCLRAVTVLLSFCSIMALVSLARCSTVMCMKLSPSFFLLEKWSYGFFFLNSTISNL